MPCGLGGGKWGNKHPMQPFKTLMLLICEHGTCSCRFRLYEDLAFMLTNVIAFFIISVGEQLGTMLQRLVSKAGAGPSFSSLATCSPSAIKIFIWDSSICTVKLSPLHLPLPLCSNHVYVSPNFRKMNAICILSELNDNAPSFFFSLRKNVFRGLNAKFFLILKMS